MYSNGNKWLHIFNSHTLTTKEFSFGLQKKNEEEARIFLSKKKHIHTQTFNYLITVDLVY